MELMLCFCIYLILQFDGMLSSAFFLDVMSFASPWTLFKRYLLGSLLPLSHSLFMYFAMSI